MKTVFYTICDTGLMSNPNNARNLDYKGFATSFRKFHPDVELLVFNEGHLKKFNANYYNAKAVFGEMLSREYDLVVNIDADHYIFQRMDEVLAADYDIACPANYNETGNIVGIKAGSGLHGKGEPQDLVSCVEFLQGGLIASPNKQFWAHYNATTKKYYDRFACYENDTLNLVAFLYPYNVKYLDGGADYRTASHKCWYGCSIIGKEKSAYIENGKIMCEGKPVKAYHFAHGRAKQKYTEVFSPEVSEFIKTQIINA